MRSRRLIRERNIGPAAISLTAAAACAALVAGCAPVGPGGTGPVLTPSPTTSISTPTPTPTPTDKPTPPTTTSASPPTSPSPTTTSNSRRAVYLGGNYSNGVFSVGVIPYGGNPNPALTGTFLIHEGSTLIGQVNVAYDPTDGYYGGHFNLALPPGRHTLTYDYSGDANYQPAHDTGVIDVNNVKMVASVPGGTVVWGDPFTVDVQVNPIPGFTGVPTGKITSDESFAFFGAEATLDATGHATLTVQPAPGVAGGTTRQDDYPIYINYEGDTTFTASRALVVFSFVPAPAG